MEISTILWILCGIFNACVIFKRVKLDNAINVLLAAMGICMGPFVTLLILISFWASHSSAVEGRKELREINMEFNARYTRGAAGPDRSGCGFSNE